MAPLTMDPLTMDLLTMATTPTMDRPIHADGHVPLAVPPPLPGYHPMPDGRAPIAAEGSQGDSTLLVRPGRWLGVGPTLTPTPTPPPTQP